MKTGYIVLVITLGKIFVKQMSNNIFLKMIPSFQKLKTLRFGD